MKRWGLRHRGFRAGFIGVVVCSIFFMIGFAAPAWKNTTGLWMTCSESHKLCISHSSHSSTASFPAWFDAVRALECLGLIGILLSMAAELYMDFLSQPSPDRRLVEMLALIAGACGLIGSIIFAVYTPLRSGSQYYSEVYLSWGFGLATASSCFFIAFASIIAYFRRKGLDVANYNASNAIHYCASEGVVVPQGFNNMDLGPPAYNDVVNQPNAGGQGSSVSGPHFNPSQPYFKPPSPIDSQPPPAYYPPPPLFQAPPPYTIVPQSSALSSGQPSSELPAESGSVPVFFTGLNQEGDQTISGGEVPLGLENGTGETGSPDTTSLPPPASGGTNPAVSGNPLVPVYYVIVLGQMVPVFREELQQSGRDVPVPAGAPVPTCFIVTQGQHVPVFTEEQAMALVS